jgi:dUTP pyrophosphatase
MLKVKLLSENAKLPTRTDSGSAGYDLYASEDTIIEARKHKLVQTGIAIAIPNNRIYGRLAPRSGLALRYGLDVGAGVVDASYRGPVSIVIFNHLDEDYEVKIGDRIAQLILEVIITPDIELVDDLDNTDRGSKGFGSSGK